MKNSLRKLTLVLLAMMLAIMVSAQQQTKTDSLEYRIQQDFQKFNKKYTTGTVLMLSGVGITALGVSAYNPMIPHSNGFCAGLMVAGTLMFSTGTILQLDAFSWLGGRKSLTIYPGGLKYTF